MEKNLVGAKHFHGFVVRAASSSVVMGRMK